MPYDLMLLADPGPPRDRVLEALRASGLEPDSSIETRFWLRAADTPVQVNIGSKDPVESVHYSLPAHEPSVLEAATRHALQLSRQLEMRLEDMQWGREISDADLEQLRGFWADWRPPDHSRQAPPRRPWWRLGR